MISLTVVSANEKVFLTGDPPEMRLPIYLFEGGEVSFQVNLWSDQPYYNGMLRFFPRDIGPRMTVRRVGLVPAVMDVAESHDDGYVIRDDHLYPDVLEKIDRRYLHNSTKTNQTFFITIHDDERIQPGTHSMGVRFYEDGKKMGFADFTLVKIPAPLPAQKCILTTWMHYDSFLNQHHVKPFTIEFYRLLGNYLDAAKIGGQNMILVPLITPAFDTQVGRERLSTQLLDIREPEPGKFVFDFSEFNRFVRFVLSRGMKYLEMPPCFSQWGAEHAPKVLVHDAGGRIRHRFGWQTDALSDDYRNFLAQMLDALHADLCELGVEDITFFHVSDEPNEEQLAHYTACKELIMQHIGNCRTIDACSSLDFVGKTDREYSVCSIATVQKYIDAGVRPLCTYYCCGPTAGYFTNRFLSQPLSRTAQLGFVLYRYNMDLFLHWGFNFYNSYLSRRPINPYITTDGEGMFTAGDPFLVYPDHPGFSANPSLRLFAMGEAMRLSRMLYMLEEYEGREAALAFLDEEGVRGITEYPRTQGWLDRLTWHLGARLAAHVKNNDSRRA